LPRWCGLRAKILSSYLTCKNLVTFSLLDDHLSDYNDRFNARRVPPNLLFIDPRREPLTDQILNLVGVEYRNVSGPIHLEIPPVQLEL
jgi:hypothetical protein